MRTLKEFFRPKKTADHALQELIAALKKALGEKLHSVVVFGSFASGEFREGQSDVNVMVLASLLDQDVLEKISGSLQDWGGLGHPPPVFLRSDEFLQTSRALPIEFLDMQEHHRVLAGVDPFIGVTLDLAHLPFQIEHDLNVLLIKLRRALIPALDDHKKVGSLIADSLPSAWVLCRAIFRLRRPGAHSSKVDAARYLSTEAGYEGALVDRLESLRQNPADAQAPALLSAYLDLVEKLLHYARKDSSLKETV